MRCTFHLVITLTFSVSRCLSMSTRRPCALSARFPCAVFRDRVLSNVASRVVATVFGRDR